MAYGSLALDEISTSGNLAIAGNVITAGDHTANTYRLAPLALVSPVAGEFEYDGGELYFTPLGNQRGLISSMQYYRLNSDYVGTNTSGAQSVFGVGVTLSSNTVYAFDAYYGMSKSSGTTSHIMSLLFGGSATINNIGYLVYQSSSSSTALSAGQTAPHRYIQVATATAITGSGLNTNPVAVHAHISGTVSINSGGTFIPQYNLSTAPGGPWSTAAGCYFRIYPIGAAGSNTSVGTWA
jgi:hypothetical protein